MAKQAYIAKRRAYLAADGSLVGHGHEKARTLLAAPGQTISEVEFERYKGSHFFFDPIGKQPSAPEPKLKGSVKISSAK